MEKGTLLLGKLLIKDEVVCFLFDDDYLIPRGYENLFKKNNPQLNEEQKNILSDFLKGVTEYLNKQKELSLNGWYIYTTPNDIIYLKDKSYTAKHLPTKIIIYMGRGKHTKYSGQYNSIEFLQAIIGHHDITRLDSCRSCKYYIKNENVCHKNQLMQGKCDYYDPRSK